MKTEQTQHDLTNQHCGLIQVNHALIDGLKPGNDGGISHVWLALTEGVHPPRGIPIHELVPVRAWFRYETDGFEVLVEHPALTPSTPGFEPRRYAIESESADFKRLEKYSPLMAEAHRKCQKLTYENLQALVHAAAQESIKDIQSQFKSMFKIPLETTSHGK